MLNMDDFHSDEVEQFEITHDDESKDGDNSTDGENAWSDGNERETWSGRFESLLSLVGYTVGLGNIWRFPYFCYRNGGGIAIIPFVLFLMTCAGPLYYIEVCLGQFSGKSPITVWNICPLFKGIGLVMVSLSLIYVWYFGTAFGWVFYFLIMSFYPTLPWSTCTNSWNTEFCIDSSTNMTEKLLNITDNSTLKTSGTEFWEKNVLNISTGIDDIGPVQLHLVGCLFLGWFLIFLCLAKGVKSLGKVVYVTVTLPYVLLTILLIRGVTLDGSWIGLRHYLIPDFSKLARGQVWMEAAVQCFFSLGPAWGGVLTMASFNKFNHNALRDTVIVCFADAFTAIFGGIVVFSVLGFLSKETNTPLNNLPISGAGLVFIAYPEALSRLPAPNLWSVLFFVTLVMVGIDSQFGTYETVVNAIIELNYRKFIKYRLWLSAGLVSILFLLSLPITTSGGYYIFMLVDWYIASFGVVFIALLECIIVAWIYGADRFSSDIEMMTGNRPSLVLSILWCFCIPVFMLGILITTIINYSDPSYGYEYPVYALIIGNLFAFVPLSLMFFVAVFQIIRTKGSMSERLYKLLHPARSWLPNDKKLITIYKKSPYRDTVIVCLTDAFTAIIGGIVVFSVLGFLSKETDTPLDKLPISGAGLAFIAYPEALSRLPAPNVWSVLFFLTLVMVGIDTQFGCYETVVNAIIDLNYRKLSKYRLRISAGLVSILFLLGLPITTSGGYYIFMLVDWYFASFGLVFIALLECIIVAWIYGADRFSCDIEMMTGTRPSLLLRIMWCFCIPFFILAILMTTILNYSDPSYGYEYPVYALVIGNLFAFVPLSLMFFVAVFQIIRTRGSISERGHGCRMIRNWSVYARSLHTSINMGSVNVLSSMY